MIKSAEVYDLKITTILDNLVQSPGPVAHWGYSVLLEYEAYNKNRRILLDTGSDKDCFLRNLKELKIDLSGIDAIVLSHGHYDHTSATVEAVKVSGGVKVYAHPLVFSPSFMVDEKGKRRKISVPEGQGVAEIEESGGKVVLSETPLEVAPGVWTTGEVQRTSFETIMELGKSRIIKGEAETLDTIPDDQSLFLLERDVGLIVVTGCAHSGPLNILQHTESLTGEKVKALIGGTHLTGRRSDYLEATINGLKKYRLSIFSPCHCTGFKAIAELSKIFPESFSLSYSGSVLEPEKLLRERNS